MMLLGSEDRRETIPAKISIEMPLPMPCVSICSPSQVMSMEPAAKVRIITKPPSTPVSDSAF